MDEQRRRDVLLVKQRVAELVGTRVMALESGDAQDFEDALERVADELGMSDQQTAPVEALATTSAGVIGDCVSGSTQSPLGYWQGFSRALLNTDPEA